ncbi:tol-pal system protein YbgF [Albirhodobacter sp. R86504]|uniref:tol-pal system protein YbgF n=1 Tax=Albirhodobacter sp. R86504 TaxID=3093848 RepID=UPI00366BA26C
MIRSLAFIAALALAAPAAAQDQSLADVRSELADLSAQLQSLRSELVASGAQGMQAAGGSSALERMDTMEASLMRLTSRTEELQNRIDRVVKDGTNRIGDLEFRLCEATPGCDIGSVGQTPTLGGESSGASVASAPAAAAPSASSNAPALAMNEQADFDRAKGVLAQGDFQGAADLFSAFAQSYPGGPLTGEAMYLRGEALEKTGDTGSAARAYLDAFSAAPEGTFAPDSLFKLGTSLANLGQTVEACATLREVGARFPNAAATSSAQGAMQSLACQ